MKLQLGYPLNPYGLNQGWGVNGAYYQTNNINIKGHNGLDLRAYHGQPIYASHDGTAFYEIDAGGGHGVVIVTNEMFDYVLGPSYYKTIYWHFCDQTKEPQYLSPVFDAQQKGDPRKGVQVKRGDLIGFADSTGFSSGDHCHFGLKPIKAGAPTSLDATDMGIGQWVNQEPNNGYLGAIDPTPFLDGAYVDQESLEARIVATAASITSQVAALPKDQQRAYLPALSQIVDSIVALFKRK